VGGEDRPLLASNVPRLAVLVANSILDLRSHDHSLALRLLLGRCHWHSRTHPHVDDHAIALVSAHGGRHDDQRVLGHKVTDASFPAGTRRRGLKLEPQGLGGAGEEDEAAEVLQQ